MSSDGEVLIEPFKFSNDADGFNLLLTKLKEFNQSNVIVVLKSTAHYSDTLISLSCRRRL
jgi:transposase